MLNALDGIYPSTQVVRFFTANFPEIVETNEAMSSRMRRKLEFKILEPDNIEKYLVSIFGQGEIVNIKTFVGKIALRKIPTRMISHYISRFIMDPSPLSSAIINVPAWFEELDSITKADSNKKRKITDAYMM